MCSFFLLRFWKMSCKKQWKLTRIKANNSMDINAWSLALWSLLALYSASSQLLLSVHLPSLDAPSVSSNTRCVIRTLCVRSLPVPTGDFIPSSQCRHTCASSHSAIVILMLGVVIEALIAANRWIFRGHTNSDVENYIGELLNNTASRGWNTFRDGGAERMGGGRRGRKKESKTHAVKSKICKLIIFVIMVIVITSVIVCSVYSLFSSSFKVIPVEGKHDCNCCFQHY